MIIMRVTPLWIAIVCLVCLCTGCAPFATYPPVEGAFELSGARTEPIPTLMVESVRYVKQKYAPDRDLLLNLPESAPPQAYSEVLSRLGEGRAMREPGELAITVEQVNVRGTNSNVTVIYPDRDGVYIRVRVDLKRPVVGSWRVIGDRIWRGRRIEPPTPNYLPIEEWKAEKRRRAGYTDTQPAAEPMPDDMADDSDTMMDDEPATQADLP
jgi:hypothetical protein